MRRSLLDHPNGRLGTINRQVMPDDDEYDAGYRLPSTTRAYRQQMAREFDGEVPTAGAIVDLARGWKSVPDDTRRGQFQNALTRTMTGISGSVGGFVLPVGVADEVFDRARLRVTPASLCEWAVAGPHEREKIYPVAYEYTANVPYGGLTPVWGDSEIIVPNPVDGTINGVKMIHNRLLLYTKLSRNISWDAPSINRWIKYVGTAAIRRGLVNAMINGSAGAFGWPCPTGAINSQATVGVPRATTNQIGVNDISALWGALSEDCQQSDRVAWHCRSATVTVLNELATTGILLPLIYFPAGTSPLGTPFGTIFGKPLIPLAESPALGSAGDLCVVDWGQYLLSYLPLNDMGSTLAFDVVAQSDKFHEGMIGIPEDAVEARMSDERYFDTDSLAILFKFRADGNFLWPNLPSNGSNSIGPAAALAH